MNNASEALYIGVYTFIFVVALSLMIFLFSSLMTYTDNSYEFMHEQGNNSVIENAEAQRFLILNGQEVISYYYNYIKKDRINNPSVNSNYNIKINLNTKNEVPIYLENTNLTYKEVIDKIGVENKYVLIIDENSTETQNNILIYKADDEDLNAVW